MNVRDLIKKVDGELVAVIREDGSQVPQFKVQAWSKALREELDLPPLPKRTVKVIKDNEGNKWAVPIVEGKQTKTWIEESTIEINKEPEREIDPRLLDPNAPAMNHLKRHNTRRRKK